MVSGWKFPTLVQWCHQYCKWTTEGINFAVSLVQNAGSDDICITMDGSEQSYRLLGNFGAGQVLYKLAEEGDGLHIHFISQRSSTAPGEFAALSPIRVKVPVLQAAEEDLYALS